MKLRPTFYGVIAGTAAGTAAVLLARYGIDNNGWFSIFSAFVLFPMIFLSSLPWSFMVPNDTGNAVPMYGLAVGAIINSGLLGGVIAWRRANLPRPANGGDAA